MKELKEIILTLHSKHLEKLPTIEDEDGDANSLQARLIEGILKSKFNTDQEAAKELYGKLYDKHRYELLKSKLKQRALSSLLLHEIKDPEPSPRDAMRVHLQRQIVSANLLLLFGARTAGVKLLKKVINLSTDYLLNDCNVEALFMLRSHYWFCGDVAMHDKTSTKLQGQIALLGIEAQAEEIYQSITIKHAQSTSNEEIPVSKLKYASKQMSHLKKYFSVSYIVRINTFKLQVAYFQMNHQYEKVAEECAKAVIFFSTDKAFRNDPLSIYFLLNQCEAHFLNAEPEKMFSCINALRRLIGEKTANRAAVDRVAFFANIYSLKYTEAEKILKSIDIRRMPTLAYQRIEWELFDAYIKIVSYCENKTDLSTLRLLTLPALAKDKHGSNISILICDTVYNILLKNHTKLLKLDKKLDNYIYRYLSKDRLNERSVIFLKMLRIIIKEDFDLTKIEMKTNLLFAKLRLNTSRSFVEIMPYQELWSLLLQACAL